MNNAAIFQNDQREMGTATVIFHILVAPEKFFKAYSKLYMNLDNEFHLVDFDCDNNFFSLLEKQGEVIELE